MMNKKNLGFGRLLKEGTRVAVGALRGNVPARFVWPFWESASAAGVVVTIAGNDHGYPNRGAYAVRSCWHRQTSS